MLESGWTFVVHLSLLVSLLCEPLRRTPVRLGLWWVADQLSLCLLHVLGVGVGGVVEVRLAAHRLHPRLESLQHLGCGVSVCL